MTSEEVKELLRQLSKDTEEVGDIRSRTVRIRLTSDEEETPSGEDETAAGEEKEQTEDVSDSTLQDTADQPSGAGSETGEESGGKESGRRSLFSALSEKMAARKKNRAERGSSSEEAEPAKAKPAEAAAPNEPVTADKDEDPLTEEDELLTRYMDEEERKAYLEEKAENSRNGREKPVKRSRPKKSAQKTGAGKPEESTGDRKNRKAPLTERREKTPVEPDEFDSDAWMFREEEMMPGAPWHLPFRKKKAGKEEPGEKTAGEPVSEEEIDLMEADGEESTGEGAFGRLKKYLEIRGFGLKEISIIGGIIVLAILIIAIVLTLLGNKRKRERVQADEGLTITVEKEPSGWCKSGEVTLAIRTDSPIQTVTIDSQMMSLSGDGRVTFEADKSPVEVTVVSEDLTRNAQVGFARIDSEDPVVTVSVEEGKISFTAQDNASGIDKIWYGTIDALSDVPSYEAYKEPFEPETGKLYSYFAKDKAGNTSVPVTTNLTPAESISLDRNEITLFPGETYALKLTTKPSKAFLNGLTWSCSDEEVAQVGSDGTVTALKDGKAVVKASAEGVVDASCVINVRSEVSVTISAVGDMTLGEDASFSTLNNFTSVYTMYGPEYFLKNVSQIFEADDITFANFEGTLTDRGSRQPKEYAFRGDPSYVQVLLDGSVEAVTLANNHSYDYGEESHEDTQKYLDEAGIEWCEGDKMIIKDVNGVRMALIGIYVLADGMARADQVKNCIAAAKEQGAQLIVAAFHWGNERELKPDETQRTLAHLAVDCGADLVVGHHPHVLQGIEKYSGKYICYSLANFCFGGNSNPSDKDTMIFQQTFRILRGGDVEDGGVSVIPCSVSSVSDWNNYQPTPATGEEAERIMARINELCQPFGTSF